MKKRYIWQPLAFLCVGVVFYVYYGVTMNAWVINIPNLLFYAFILAILSWTLYKKDKIQQERNRNNN